MHTQVNRRQTLSKLCDFCRTLCIRQKSSSTCPFTSHQEKLSTISCPVSRESHGNGQSDPGAVPREPRTIPGPKSYPVIGTLYKYIPYFGEYSRRNQMQTDRRRYQKYGSLVKEELFPGFVIYHVYDPNLIREVYHQERNYPERFPLPGLKAYREDRQYGNGIALSSGEEWKRLRGASADLMKPRYLKNYFEDQVEISGDLTKLISNAKNGQQEVTDSLTIFYRYALECVCNVLFGKRFGILEPHLEKDSDAMKLIEAVLVVMDSLCSTTFFWPLHKKEKSTDWRDLCESSDLIRNIGLSHAQQCKTELETQPDGGRMSYLKTLISKPQLTSQDCLNIVADVIFAGIETTGHVVAFNMYNLARNPDKQQRLYEEIQKYVPDDKSLTDTALTNMKYLKAVMKETFRYTPLGVGNARITTKENTVLNGYDIPKGSLLMLNNLIPSELPEYVSQPEKYLPERWTGENGDKLHPYLVLPFGLGGRSCIGRRLAMQEMQVAIVKLIQKFRVEYHHEPISFITRFANTPDRPLQLRFVERNI